MRVSNELARGSIDAVPPSSRHPVCHQQYKRRAPHASSCVVPAEARLQAVHIESLPIHLVRSPNQSRPFDSKAPCPTCIVQVASSIFLSPCPDQGQTPANRRPSSPSTSRDPRPPPFPASRLIGSPNTPRSPRSPVKDEWMRIRRLRTITFGF